MRQREQERNTGATADVKEDSIPGEARHLSDGIAEMGCHGGVHLEEGFWGDPKPVVAKLLFQAGHAMEQLKGGLLLAATSMWTAR